MGPGAGRHQGRAQAVGTGTAGRGQGGRQGADGGSGVPGRCVGPGSVASSPAGLLSPLLRGRATRPGAPCHRGQECMAHAGPSHAADSTGGETLAVLPSPGMATAKTVCAGSHTCRVAGNVLQIPAAGMALGCPFPPPPPRAVPHPRMQQKQKPPTRSKCFILIRGVPGRC